MMSMRLCNCRKSLPLSVSVRVQRDPDELNTIRQDLFQLQKGMEDLSRRYDGLRNLYHEILSTLQEERRSRR